MGNTTITLARYTTEMRIEPLRVDINVLKAAATTITFASGPSIELRTAVIGPRGPAGATGAGVDLNYTHIQGFAADTWDIHHSLGKYPAVTVVDSSNDEVEGSIHYIDADHVQVTFSAAFSGTAYLN